MDYENLVNEATPITADILSQKMQRGSQSDFLSTQDVNPFLCPLLFRENFFSP
jgi:hypothetical protein